jgi:hypothetical protein
MGSPVGSPGGVPGGPPTGPAGRPGGRRRGRPGWRRVVVAVVVLLGVLVVAGIAVLVAGGRGAVGDTGASSSAIAPWDGDVPGGSGEAGAAPTRGSAEGVAPESADGVAPQPPDLAVPGPPGTFPAPLPAPAGRDLVRTAHVSVEVDDIGPAVRRVRAAVGTAGAFVAEEQSDETGAWLVLRVPADGLDRLVEQVGGIGEVVARAGRVEDVTEQVVDLDSRVTSQQASVERVRALLARAESIGDVVAVEAELARREAELDSLLSRRAALRDQVALSTLTVEIRGGTDAGPGDDRSLGFAAGLGAGWDGLRALGAAVAAVVGFVLPFVPVLAVLAVIGWVLRRVVRSRRAGRPAVAAGVVGGGPAGGDPAGMDPAEGGGRSGPGS